MRGEHVAGVALALLTCLGAADGKENRAAYNACVEYHAQMFRLCRCQFETQFCEQTFGFLAQYKCPQVKALSDAKSFYGSCLAKLRRASCATPRRGLMDAPQSCESAFVERTAEELRKNPWGEIDVRPAKRNASVSAATSRVESAGKLDDPPTERDAVVNDTTHATADGAPMLESKGPVVTPTAKAKENTDFIDPWAESLPQRPKTLLGAKGAAASPPVSTSPAAESGQR